MVMRRARAFVVVVLLFHSVQTPSAQMHQVEKIRVTSTAVDALCVGGSGQSPATCTGGAKLGSITGPFTVFGKATFPTGSDAPLITGASGGNFLVMTSTGTGATTWVQYLNTSSAMVWFNGSDRMSLSSAGALAWGSGAAIADSTIVAVENGTNTFTAHQKFTTGVRFSGACADSTTGSQLAYQPACTVEGQGTAVFALRWTGSADITIQGFGSTLSDNGNILTIFNAGSANVNVNHEDAAESAFKRIISHTGANFVIGQGKAATFWYDTTSSRWRVLSIT